MLGFFARNKKPDAVAEGDAGFEKPLVGRALLAVEEFHRAEHLFAEPNGQRERRAQTRLGRLLSAQETLVDGEIDNPGGPAAPQHSPDKPYLPGLVNSFPARREERRDLRVVGSPGFLATKAPRCRVHAPARPASEPQRLAERGENSRHGGAERFRVGEQPRYPVLDRLALLGVLALGDVDDGPDEPGDVAVVARERRLVVERVADAAVVDRDRKLVAARARIAPQILVRGVMLCRDLRGLGKQVLNGLADEGFARDAEVGFPGLVRPEVPSVPRFEVDRDGQSLDQLPRDAQRLRVFVPALGKTGEHGDRVDALGSTTAALERFCDIGKKLLAPAPVFRGLDAVPLADGGLRLPPEPLKHDFGLRRGIPLPSRHPPSFKPVAR